MSAPFPVLTTVVTTRDEELHIGRCIDSAIDLGPVIVVDSGSQDATLSLAREHGANVVQQKWLGYAAQKNWALKTLPIQTDWILFLDADERLTERGRAEIREVIANTSAAGLYVARENIVLGRHLRHAWWYPDFQMRVFKKEKARYEDRLVHEHVLIDGDTEHLREPLIHENLKGVDAWMQRHIRYARLEAEEMLKQNGTREDDGVEASFLGTRAERRRALKTRIWYRLPMRPAIRFFWMYCIRRGFLDGRAGLVYCQLMASYEALIDANLLELESARR
jgi:glycosyltransferase involved in cell wall biosynthesis